ncbi:uncharacterized protein LOC127801220 [Diospyros lotus]|uniref:uncharacterized protein LOC127801220 n=1 Tax=Diospyros lotus TaxID=55363 RepID=UPI0022535ADE|nr:uncharacterized protein LOC127801220 [Diospyros lotus]XP_052192102.1 uncharacterized protein LOC127801220 [Diospyros lotus]XP_052192103.1 uncharacterized protein LOC127801220 [Diospyros lotus]XP_052192104.1 uncharacterized protein LOC127801220 [Diospyros lotus]XP_052192105.1 uncharacterized protein LOC127801220 [Diospyros lotus]XP_052192106.1 uncharacterized protein LOC127801220 [Diospyros lotus]
MDEFGSERSKTWNIYTSSDPSPSHTVVDREGPWKSYGSSMNAISFGFVATAILISMFLIMAIFEHLFRPTSFSSSQDSTSRSLETCTAEKLRNQQSASTMQASDFSVVMPGQHCPTFIAQPAPLLPCPREGVHWPPHEHDSTLP